MKTRIIFRIFPFNILTFPILLNVWEKEGIDKEFEIIISDKIVKPQNGDVYIYSFMTPFLPIIYNEIKQINNKNIIIAGGGPHISGETELSFGIGFDILFVGSGEGSFLDFGLDLINSKIIKERKIYYQKDVDLDKYLPISKYFDTIPPIEIIRGCFWNCKYCQTGKNAPIFRKVESIKEYFEFVSSKGHNRVNFISPSAFGFKSKKKVGNPIQEIEKLLKLANSFQFKFVEYGIFPSEIRPESISVDGIRILKKYVSNKMITIGAQSGDDNRLKKLNRGHNINDIVNAVKIINDNGFLANLDFIIGYPDETENERNKTFEFIKSLYRDHRLRVQFHYFFPLSGSKLQYRFPAKLSHSSRDKLLNMNKNGIGKNGWIQNEIDSDNYFKWLKTLFPEFYSLYTDDRKY